MWPWMSARCGGRGFMGASAAAWEARVQLMAARKGLHDSLGPRHQGTLTIMNCLAELLQAQGKLNEAELLMLKVLEAERAPIHSSAA